MNKKISVILPVSDLEAYLDECVNSIINQTIGFENIDEAIAWMRKSGFLNDSYIRENIESKIANAIKNNKLYCGRKWKYVNN